MDTELSEKQFAFLNELAVIGDEMLVCKRQSIDPLLLLDWEEIPDFKFAKRQTFKRFLSTIENNISRSALNALHEILQHGDRHVVNTRVNREVFDLEGNLHRLSTHTVTQKTNRNPSWAIKEGLKLHLLKRLEDSISQSLSTLIDHNVIPENLKDQILQVLDKNDEQIQNIFSGTVADIQIDEQMLAEIQATLLGQ